MENNQDHCGRPLRVIVAGSRGISDYETVKQAIDASGFVVESIVSGKARGVDTLGEQYAKEHKLPTHEFPAQWDREGRRAGFIRNALMADFADALVAVWDGQSRGTKHMINEMKKLDKLVHVAIIPKV